jgi:integrase
MSTPRVNEHVRTVETADPKPSSRDWFLQDSHWEDALWTFAPTNVLEERESQHIRWDFRLPSGRCFTNPVYVEWLETTRRLIALIRTRALSTGLPQRSRTAVGYFAHVRPLIQWMDRQGMRTFADLDAAALNEYETTLRARPGRQGREIQSSTVRSYFTVLVYLYRFRDELGDGLLTDPFPGERAHFAPPTGGGYTPDAIAVPLVLKSIEFLEIGAVDILRAREIYAHAMVQALTHMKANANRNRYALHSLAGLRIHTPEGTQRILCMQNLSDLVNLLYAACFIVISYLTGARVSEVLHLRAGCAQARRTHGHERRETTVIVGTLFKHQGAYHGSPHEWVAPDAALHAIAVLEALSAPHRHHTRRAELFLRGRVHDHSGGATEWQRTPNRPYPARVTTPTVIKNRLRQYAHWLYLPPFKGKPWPLTGREARKTFARFVALRDRTGLHALAQQLGHRDRSMTDSGYAGTDYALEREIKAEVLEQSVLAWEHMLSAPQLGGSAGREILAKRPQFRGSRAKANIKAYARTLVEAGLVLGVCDWGYCVYRQEYSACHGNAVAPNPVHREPSTCARCLNFVVSVCHRPYWQEQQQRYEQLLNIPALPTQTLKIARERLAEAKQMLRALDSSHGEPHVSNTAH